MLRSNFNQNQQTNNFVEFSTDEKQELIDSLQYLGLNFENFVISFYETFLQNKTLEIIQNNTKESLINMLVASLNIIISSIEHPIPIIEYKNILNSKYPDFTNMLMKRDLFIKSFMFAIVDTFKDNYNERLGYLWFKQVSDFINSYFLSLKQN